jgi:ribosomal protein S18 acetylase RimI-like enzyme
MPETPGGLRLRVVMNPQPDARSDKSLLEEVLALQQLVLWRSDTEPGDARGFLATSWSLDELQTLMAEGAYLIVAVAEETNQLQGYSLMAPIRHLPPGDFVAAAGSPVGSRAELLDDARFVYGYQLAVRPDRTSRHRGVGAAIISAVTAENARRGINAVSCLLETPVSNERSMAFLSAMGLQRIGTIRDPRGPSLMRGPVTWACMTRLPLRSAGAN